MRGPGQTHLIPGFAGLLFAVMIRQNQPFVCRLRHLALLAAHVLEYALLSMPVRLSRLANGHGPLGRLLVGFRAKSAIFLVGTQKSCFSRCGSGALAVRITTAIGYTKLYLGKSLSLSVAVLSLSVRRPAATAKATRLRRERLRQVADATTASAFFRILPAPAIRLRFAPAE